MVSTAAFPARVWGSFPGLGFLKETKMFVPHPLVKLSIVGSLLDRELACSASDLQGLYFDSCVWRAVSSYHPQGVLLAQFSLYVHKSPPRPDSFPRPTLMITRGHKNPPPRPRDNKRPQKSHAPLVTRDQPATIIPHPRNKRPATIIPHPRNKRPATIIHTLVTRGQPP